MEKKISGEKILRRMMIQNGLVAILVLIPLLSGCRALMRGESKPNPIFIDYDVPTLTAVDKKEMQGRQGIKIAVEPYPFMPVTMVSNLYRAVPRGILFNPAEWPAQRKASMYISINPPTVRFKVKVYNQQDHVLRLAGSVLSFQVAGKKVAIDEMNYKDFLDGVILPRETGEYEIQGPPLGLLPRKEKTTLALMLYDVVSKTDEAGNPKKRVNFEYFYKLTWKHESAEGSENIIPLTLNANGMQILQNRGGANGDWVSVPEFDRNIGD